MVYGKREVNIRFMKASTSSSRYIESVIRSRGKARLPMLYRGRIYDFKCSASNVIRVTLYAVDNLLLLSH